MTIKQTLEYAIKKLKEHNIEDSMIKTKSLLAYVLSKPKEYLIINSELELDSEKEIIFNNLRGNHYNI